MGKDKSLMGPRSKSAHSNLNNTYSKSTKPQIVVDTAATSDYPQSKEDKNKNNTIIAKRASSMTENIPTPSKEKSPSVRRYDDTDDEYMQYLNSVDRYRQNNPNPKPFRPVTARTDAIANPLRKMSDGQGQAPVPGSAPAPVRQQSFSFTPQAKSKQTTPVRDNSEVGARISRSVPKEVIRKTKEQTQAEILGLVKTNKETGQVEKTNDMDYEDYMNIINKVRKTKEHTRVRTEQARLASMYAQELKRQEEIKLEEQRLRVERQRLEEEKRNANKMPIITTVSSLLSQTKTRADYSMEKGQLDNIEQEQSKISPSTSTTAVLAKQAPIAHPNQSNTNSSIHNTNEETTNQTQNVLNYEKQVEEQRKMEEKMKKEREKEEIRMLEAIRNEQIQQQKMREKQVLAEQKKLEKLTLVSPS